MHKFPKFTPIWNSTCFGQFVCPSSGVYSLYTQQWYMSYRFVDSFRAGPGWNRSSILVLLESCLQTCMTYTIADCTANKLLIMVSGTVSSWSCSKAVYKTIWHIPLLSVRWINSQQRAEELSETCRVSCRSKFGKLVHLVGFIIHAYSKVIGKDFASHQRFY